MSVVETETVPAPRGRTRKPAKTAPTARPRTRKPPRTRRTPVEVHKLKRTKEGREFELYGIAPELEPFGYQVTPARLSRGPYDVAAWRPGELLLVAARLTGVALDGSVNKNPEFRTRELEALWGFAQRSQEGFKIVPLVSTALHAAAPDKACRCSGKKPDRARFMILTGPLAGPSRRPNWEPWAPAVAVM